MLGVNSQKTEFWVFIIVILSIFIMKMTLYSSNKIINGFMMMMKYYIYLSNKASFKKDNDFLKFTKSIRKITV